MASSGFEDALNACLHHLEAQLSTEHRHAVQALEARIRELEAEIAQMPQTAKGVGAGTAAAERSSTAAVARKIGRRNSEPADTVLPQYIPGGMIGRHSYPSPRERPEPPHRPHQRLQFSPVMPVIPGMLQPSKGSSGVSSRAAPNRHDTPRPSKKVSFGESDIPSRNGSLCNLRDLTPEPPSPRSPPPNWTPCKEIPSPSSSGLEGGTWEPCGAPAPTERPPVLPLQRPRSHQSWVAIPANAGAYQMLDAWAVSANMPPALGRGNTHRTMSRHFSQVDLADDDEEFSPLAGRMLRYMLRPNSLKHKLWVLLSVGVTLGDVGVIPLQYLVVGPGEILVGIQTWASRLHMTLGVFLPFFMGYVSKSGAVEMRFDKVAKQYVRGRLPVNCLLLAGDWMVVAVRAMGRGALASNLLLIVRAAKAIKVARSQTRTHLMDCLLENITSEVAIIQSLVLMIILVFVLFVHVISCIWYGIHSDFCEVRGFREDAAGACSGAPFWDRYTSSFHFVLSLSVGEHVFVPTEVTERCFTIVVLLAFFIVSAAIVGSLTTAMTRLQVIASRRSAQFATLKKYLSASGISSALAARVHRNAHHASVQQLGTTDERSVELLGIISEPLRAEIHYEVYAPVVTTHPFFHLYNLCDRQDVCHICHSTVSEVSISPGDVLFSEFELPIRPKMFFVVKGKLNYNRAAVEDYEAPQRTWISEAALWTTWTHQGTLSAKTASRFLVVDGGRFINVARTFPNNTASAYAKAFVGRLNEKKAETILTDIGEDTSDARIVAYESVRGQLHWDDKEALAWIAAKARQTGRRGTKNRAKSPEPTKWCPDDEDDDEDDDDWSGKADARSSSSTEDGREERSTDDQVHKVHWLTDQ